MIDIWSLFNENIFLIRRTPSSSVHLIFIFCFSSVFFCLFSTTFLIASCLSFGIYFEIRDSSFRAELMKSIKSAKFFRIFSFMDFSSSPRICLNAVLIA